MEDKDSKGKSGWYPGKYAGRSKPSTSDEKKSYSPDDKKISQDRDEDGEDQEESSNKDKKGWYPGKLMTKAARRVSMTTSSSNYEERRQSVKTNSSGYSSDANSDYISDSPVEKRKPQFEHLETVGKVRVRIPAIRYLNITSATFIIELEDFAAFFDYSPESYVEFDRTFELKDITSDIVITISGNGQDGTTTAGVIVVPLVSLLGFNGAPTPSKEVWRQVYPIYTKAKTENFKFTSGFSDPQGYALTKPKESLGFVSMISELNLYHQPLKTYFFGEAKCHIAEYALELLSEQAETKQVVNSYEEADETLNVALVNRNFQRLHNVLLPLACLSPVLHLPEVFILVGVFGFFCFSLQVYQLPLFLFCFALFNGIYTMLNRGYSKVFIWNDSTFTAAAAVSTPSPHSSMRVRSVSQADASAMQIVMGLLTGAAANSAPSATQRTVFSVYAKHLHAIVHYLEVFSNLFSFADSRVSIIFYIILFALAVLTSLFLSLFSFRALLLVTVSFALLVYAGRDVVYDYFFFRIKSAKDEKAAKVMKHLTMLNALLSKVPDELELVHRYIAGTSIVNEKGAEMSDAAAAFK